MHEPSCHPVRVGGITVGGLGLVVMAGPSAVETAEQLFSVARAVKASGAHMLWGGAAKPQFASGHGPGRLAVDLLQFAGQEVGLPTVMEVADPRDVELLALQVDLLQIGARNMYNSALLLEAGRTGVPVLLKRGLSATLEEWLAAAEQVRGAGGEIVLMCEGGIRSSASSTRHMLDLGSMVLVKRQGGTPVVVDPSSAAGRRDLVIPLACAAVAAGSDSLLVDVHPDPDHALVDGQQALSLEQFSALMGRVRQLVRLAEGPIPDESA